VVEKGRFGWKQCFWLCLPALLVGAALRIWLLAVIPEGSYSADSPSYFETTVKLAEKHDLSVGLKRRWLYPLLLVPTPLIPPSPVRVVPFIQHAIGLVTILGVGWIVGHLTRLRMLWVPAVTMLYAVWPRILWYEHEIVAEAVFLAGFILLAALAARPGALRNPRQLLWFLLTAAAVVALRPHGRGVWLAAIVSAYLLTRTLNWGWKNWAAVAFGLLIIKTSGNNTQGNWLLLNSTLPLVNLEGETWREYREALRVVVMETRADGIGYAWTQENYKKRLQHRDPSKINETWAKLNHDKPLFSKVCASFSREALVRHPLRFTQLTLAKCLIALRADSARANFSPAVFWPAQDVINATRWPQSPREMQMAYKLNPEEYAALSAERRTRTFGGLPFLNWVSNTFGWVKVHFNEQTRHLSFDPRPMGWLALLGLAVCLFSRRFSATAVLWLSAGLYMLTVFAVADRLPRFVHPVEWVGWVLAAIALDALLCGAWFGIKRLAPRDSPAA